MGDFETQWNLTQIFLQDQDFDPLFSKTLSSINNLETFQFGDINSQLDLFCSISNNGESKPNPSINKKLRINPKKKRIFKIRYQKNICSYILKKVIRSFLQQNYRVDAQDACVSANTSFPEVQQFCLSKIEKLNGISSPRSLLMPKKKQEINKRLAVLNFAEWFLKQRYIRHLIKDGKMKHKLQYLKFKNKFIMKQMEGLRKDIAELQNIFDCSSMNQLDFEF